MVNLKEYDGQTLKQAFKAAELLLEKRIEEINNLNVFPVPDGDTGINMYLTLQAANVCVENLETVSAAEISAKVARGALLGARGNSGVIFSQILRGLAKGLEMKERFSASDFAEALRVASDCAYRSIAQPVEGTILTVIREASEMALQRARRGADLKETLVAVASQAKATVLKTPELLPRLREAGVVDAGGKGLFYFFLGMKNYLSRTLKKVVGRKTNRLQADLNSIQASYGIDLQFLLEGCQMPLEKIRGKVNQMGESVLVVGDESLIRVHVHTQRPQAVMDYCTSFGRLKDLVQENLDLQVRDFEKARAKTPSHSNLKS
jgi:DAK2 domain fusion protein YloV